MKSLEIWAHTSSTPQAKGGNINLLAAHLIAAPGEFGRAFPFLSMGYLRQTVMITQSGPSSSIAGGSSGIIGYTALVYGLSLIVNAWAIYCTSGGLLNATVIGRLEDSPSPPSAQPELSLP